jgi:hypothetical protein
MDSNARRVFRCAACRRDRDFRRHRDTPLIGDLAAAGSRFSDPAFTTYREAIAVGSFVLFGTVSVVIASGLVAGHFRKLFNRANETARLLALAQRITRWDQMDLHDLR